MFQRVPVRKGNDKSGTNWNVPMRRNGTYWNVQEHNIVAEASCTYSDESTGT